MSEAQGIGTFHREALRGLPIPESSALDLLQRAVSARKTAHAPYSGFLVGAAALTANGNVYAGCNVENASYGATICAERVALVSAVAAGDSDIRALAVVADYSEPVPPCGICLQVASEFGRDMIVLMANLQGQLAVRRLSELLPSSFDMKRANK